MPVAKTKTPHDDSYGFNAHNNLNGGGGGGEFFHPQNNAMSHGHIGAFGLLEEPELELWRMGVEVHVEGEEAPLYNL